MVAPGMHGLYIFSYHQRIKPLVVQGVEFLVDQTILGDGPSQSRRHFLLPLGLDSFPSLCHLLSFIDAIDIEGIFLHRTDVVFIVRELILVGLAFFLLIGRPFSPCLASHELLVMPLVKELFNVVPYRTTVLVVVMFSGGRDNACLTSSWQVFMNGFQPFEERLGLNAMKDFVDGDV